MNGLPAGLGSSLAVIAVVGAVGYALACLVSRRTTRPFRRRVRRDAPSTWLLARVIMAVHVAVPVAVLAILEGGRLRALLVALGLALAGSLGLAAGFFAYRELTRRRRRAARRAPTPGQRRRGGRRPDTSRPGRRRPPSPMSDAVDGAPPLVGAARTEHPERRSADDGRESRADRAPVPAGSAPTTR